LAIKRQAIGETFKRYLWLNSCIQDLTFAEVELLDQNFNLLSHMLNLIPHLPGIWQDLDRSLFIPRLASNL
jgi:hypothetical protein